MEKRTKHVYSVAAVTAMAAVAARGGGFDLPDQDAFAIARGMAFVATADNPSAVYYNPAGITQMEGNNFRGGLYGIYLDPTYQRPSPDDTVYGNAAKLHALPQLYYTYSPSNSIVAFGAGLFSPYGLGLRWPQETGFRTLAIQSALTYLTFNPVVAVKPIPTLSLAAGLTVNYAQAQLEQGLFWPYSGQDNFTFRGEGWAVGYNLGLRWQPIDQISLGASFRSKTSINFGGHTDYYNNQPIGPIPTIPAQRVSATSDLDFPMIVIAGLSYRPTPKWNIEFDADYIDWSVLQTVTIKQASGYDGILPQNLPLVLDWQASWYYELGATRYFDNGWHVSAGYIFNQNSVPDAHYTPYAADLDRHFISAGVGHHGQKWDWDIAYQFGYGPTRTVTGSAASAAGQSADGRWEFISHAIAVSVGLHF